MNLSVFLTCTSILVCFVATENTVPVFVLDYDLVLLQVRVDRNPLKKVSSNDFAQLVKESAKNKVIIFLEETFSVEDISTKDPLYGTPFKNLQSNLRMDKNTVKYLPSVIQPRKVLRDTFPQKADKIINLAQRTKLQLKGNFDYVYMNFQDLKNETKANIFRRHDNIIKDVMGALRAMQAGPIVAFYTGKVNRLAVKKVERKKGSKHGLMAGKGVIVQSSRVLFRLYGVHVTTPTRRFYYDQQPTIIHEIRNKHKLTAYFPIYNFWLIWKFEYFYSSIVITDLNLYEGKELVGTKKLNIVIYYKHAYFCDIPVTITDLRDGGTFTIHSIYIDPMYDQNAEKPHPIHYCNPIMVHQEVLSCFMIGYLLLFLILISLNPLIDCTTNSRFDQPDGRYLIHEKLH